MVCIKLSATFVEIMSELCSTKKDNKEDSTILADNRYLPLPVKFYIKGEGPVRDWVSNRITLMVTQGVPLQRRVVSCRLSLV